MKKWVKTGRPVRLWATLDGAGQIVLSLRKPIVVPIMLTERRLGVYPRPGDMVFIPHLCEEGIRLWLGFVPEVGVPVRIRVPAEVLEGESKG